MFDNTMIVQSAVSAFNNAALAAPAFFWWAVLSIPLFTMVYFCGGAFMERIGWNARNIKSRASLTTVVLTLAWLVLFGGNYGVLRDNATVLPFMVAAIVFVSSVFIGSNLKKLKLPQFRGAARSQKLGIIGAWAVILVAFGLSDIHTWWGPILQIGAFVGGLLVGRAARNEMRPIAGTALVMLATVVAILMQPEFFRFGQLGALTAIHLIFLILIAGFISAVVALRNVKPSGFIRRSAFIKLKWLARFIAILCIALFVLTESVPVFLGMTFMFFVLFAMSIKHSESKPERIDEKLFSIALGLFGIITTMPVITALGILYWINLPRYDLWQKSKYLL